MPLFDSLCTAFGTAGLGGFGIKTTAWRITAYLQNVCTVFMALFGVNFSVYFLLLLREWRGALLDEELLLYGGIMLTAMFVIAADITPLFSGFGEAFHHASFTVSSVMTTTGFATEDFNLWPQLSRAILCILMVVGASAGSTGGGIKVARLLLLFKSLAAEVRAAAPAQCECGARERPRCEGRGAARCERLYGSLLRHRGGQLSGRLRG
ncbi:MAG: potassium transporter TrkG [Ruthenibacterium lactatiformans]